MTLAKSLQTQEARPGKVVASGPAGAEDREDRAADSKAAEACGDREDRDILEAVAAGDKASAAATPTSPWKSCLS